MEKYTTNDLAKLSSSTAEKMVTDTLHLLKKSLDLLDYEPDNKSARFNILHGFIKDIDDCRIILTKNTNISKQNNKILNDLLVELNSKRLSKIKELDLR